MTGLTAESNTTLYKRKEGKRRFARIVVKFVFLGRFFVSLTIRVFLDLKVFDMFQKIAVKIPELMQKTGFR